MSIYSAAMYIAMGFLACYLGGFVRAALRDVNFGPSLKMSPPPPPPPGSRPPRTYTTPTVSEELARHGIPNAPDIMAGLVALKIAKIEATDKWLSRDHYFDLELSNGRKLEVRVHAKSRSIGARLTEPEREVYDVRVGMPGPPSYRNIELSESGKAMIIEASKNLRKSAEARQRHRLDVESNEAALEALENLL